MTKTLHTVLVAVVALALLIGPSVPSTRADDDDKDALRSFNYAKTARDFYVCAVCGYTTTNLNFEKCASCFDSKDRYVNVGQRGAAERILPPHLGPHLDGGRAHPQREPKQSPVVGPPTVGTDMPGLPGRDLAPASARLLQSAFLARTIHCRKTPPRLQLRVRWPGGRSRVAVSGTME
jgi:hypothetical protein